MSALHFWCLSQYAFSFLWRIFAVSSREECTRASPFLRNRLKEADKERTYFCFNWWVEQYRKRIEKIGENLDIPATFGTIWKFCNCDFQRRPQASHFYLLCTILDCKITRLLRAFSLVDRCVQIRTCKYGCDVLGSRVFLEFFLKQ